MKTGLVGAGVAPTWFLRQDQAVAVAGGARSLWLPDHLMNLLPRSIWKRQYTGAAVLAPSADAFLEPYTTLGYLAAKTRLSRLGLGVAVTDAGRRHPAVVAQAFASLHLLSRGRALLGIGTGERQANTPYGVDWSAPVGRLEEALAVIRALWDSGGRAVTRKGRWFPLEDAIFDVPPYRDTRPPIFVAAHGPRMLRLTGRWADGWMPAWAMAPKAYGERLQAVRDAAADAERDPSAIEASGFFFVMVASSKDAAAEILDTTLARAWALSIPADEWSRFGVEHPLGAEFSGGHDLLPQLIDEPTAVDYAARVPEGLVASWVMAGTPAEVTERFAEYREHGLRYPVLLNLTPYFHLRKGLPAMPQFVKLMRTLKRM